MKVIAFADGFGGVGVIHPAPQESIVSDFMRAGDLNTAETIADMTHDQYVEWVKDKDVPVKIVTPPEGTPSRLHRAEAERLKLAYTEIPSNILEAPGLPTDRTFRNAWAIQSGEVAPDLAKCKTIAHDKRRVTRAKEFAPLDVQATIPAMAVQAEAARQVIRDRYATIQTQMDSASDVATLKALVESLP